MIIHKSECLNFSIFIQVLKFELQAVLKSIERFTASHAKPRKTVSFDTSASCNLCLINQLVRDICLKPATFVCEPKIQLSAENVTIILQDRVLKLRTYALPIVLKLTFKYHINYNANCQKTFVYLESCSGRRQLLSFSVKCTAQQSVQSKTKEFTVKTPTYFNK